MFDSVVLKLQTAATRQHCKLQKVKYNLVKKFIAADFIFGIEQQLLSKFWQWDLGCGGFQLSTEKPLSCLNFTSPRHPRIQTALQNTPTYMK